MSTRRRHTPDQIIRKLNRGNKLLAGGSSATTSAGFRSPSRPGTALAGPMRQHEGRRCQTAQAARG